MKNSTYIRTLLGGVAFSLFGTQPALAQASEPAAAPTPAPAAAAGQLGDIIVTAQRRSERLQDVPISITAANAAALAEQRVFNVENIASVTPSISFRSTATVSSSSNILIRGIGTSGTARSFEGSVGVFIDGVYRTRSGMAMSNFLDIDSLQVLRGPQGTLFGKNTSAGAILLTSTTPSTSATGGRFEVTYGNYDSYRVMAAVNAPLGDKAAIRIAAVQSDHDGYVRNVNGGRLNEQKDRGLKAQLLFQPSDDFKIQLIGDYAKGTGNCCFGVVNTTAGPTAPLIQFLTVLNGKQNPSAELNDYEASISPDTATKVEDYGGTILADLNIGSGTLKSITALRKYDLNQFQDADFSGADILTLNESFSSRFLSQELNYNGKIEGAIRADYIFGAFYSSEKIGIDRQTIHGSQAQLFWNIALGSAGLPLIFTAPPGPNDAQRFDQRSRSYALFTHWDFKVADHWNIIAGLRASKEVKRGGMVNVASRDPIFDVYAVLGLNPAIAYQSRSNDKAISGTAGIQYRPSRDAMLYLTYNRGFKAGGVILDTTAAGLPGSSIPPLLGFFPALSGNPVYKKETVDAVEAGFKVDWLGRKARTNFSVFYNKLKNLQVAQFVGLRFTVLNAPTAEVYGAEIEQTFKLTPNLTLTGAATWLPKAAFGSSVLLGVPLSDRRFATAPKFAGQTALNGNVPLSPNLALIGRVQVQYTSKVYTNTFNNDTQGGFALINANLGVTVNDRITLEGWVQNLTDKRYVTQHFGVPLQSDPYPAPSSVAAYVGAPRTYGMTLRGSF